MKRYLVAAVLLALALAVCRADVPVRTEQVIWSVLAFNGRDYSSTFVPESSNTLFLLAGVDNVVSLRETLVYWWPVTSEWKTDTDSLNAQFPGSLELRDAKGATRKLPLEQYTYFNIQGEYEQNWKVVTGEAARQELLKYGALYDSYFSAIQEYKNKTANYEAELQSLVARIQKLKREHKDDASLQLQMRSLVAPSAPSEPTHYAEPPVPLQQGFILNLVPGRYSLRLLNAEGRTIEGSEKSLIAYNRQGTGGIGFEVIPGDKWTRPETSVSPSSVLYVNGSADLYLRPFFEEELNDLEYEKTLDNAARGNPNVATWVRIQQVPHATVVVEKTGATKILLTERPYHVEQVQGSTLGYTIVPWEPNGPYKDKQPDLVAFRVPLGANVRSLGLRALDSQGEPLSGSQRQVRIVGTLRNLGLVIAFALAPLLAMLVILVLRARFYAAKPERET
jgi:hypothetical protein